MKRVLMGLTIVALLNGAATGVLANAAHHPGGGGDAGAAGSPASQQPAPPPLASTPIEPASNTLSDTQLALPPGTTEVALSDSADIGVSMDKDVRQPSLYDLMMRIMNLMQPHMKEMMDGVKVDLSGSPNLVVDLDNPLGVKSNSKATPQSGGSGSLIVTPGGVIDPVSANMGGMGSSSGSPGATAQSAPPVLSTIDTSDPQQLREQLAAIVAQITVLNKKVLSLTEALEKSGEGTTKTAPAQSTEQPQAPGQTPGTPQGPPPASTSPSGTRLEL